jgi:hypothetical protein
MSHLFREKGEGSREKGEERREKEEGRREKGEGRREKGEGKREKGKGRREECKLLKTPMWFPFFSKRGARRAGWMVFLPLIATPLNRVA